MADQHGGDLPASNGQDGGTAAVVPGSISLDQVTHQADGSVSLDEAAQQLGISDRTVRRRIKEGTLAAYKLETPRGQVWRIYLPGTPADQGMPPRRHGDQDGGDLPAPAAVVDTTSVSDANTSPELLKALDLIERLQHQHAEALEQAHRENSQLAGQVGFLQAKLQDAEEQIRLLMAPKEAPPIESEQRRPWWRRVFNR